MSTILQRYPPWQVCQCEQGVYYYNEATQESTWTKPVEVSTLVSTILQRYPPWQVCQCEQGVYYYNEATQESTWTKPVEVSTLEVQHQATPRLELERLEGRWKDKQGNRYTVSRGGTTSMNVETKRPNGEVRFTHGLIKLESSRISWGRNFELAAPAADEVRWVSDRRGDFVWHKISRTRNIRKKKSRSRSQSQNRRRRKSRSRGKRKRKRRRRSEKKKYRSSSNTNSCSTWGGSGGM